MLIRGCPSFKFVPLQYQIVSRLGSSTSDSQEVLCELISKMCQDHPYHTLPQLLAIINDDQCNTSKESSDRDRSIYAANILRLMKRSAGGNSTCVTMSILLEVRIRYFN